MCRTFRFLIAIFNYNMTSSSTFIMPNFSHGLILFLEGHVSSLISFCTLKRNVLSLVSYLHKTRPSLCSLSVYRGEASFSLSFLPKRGSTKEHRPCGQTEVCIHLPVCQGQGLCDCHKVDGRSVAASAPVEFPPAPRPP